MINKLVRWTGIFLGLWAVVYLTQIFYYTFKIVIAPAQHQAIFLALIVILTFLSIPLKKGNSPGRWYDWIFIVLAVVPCGYVALFYNTWLIHASSTTQFYELILSACLLISLLEGLRRSIGIVLPILLICFLLHPLFRDHLPGILSGRAYTLERVGSMIFFTPEGIFSFPLNVAATIIIAFVIFGQILIITGGGQVLINFILALVGRVSGGGGLRHLC